MLSRGDSAVVYSYHCAAPMRDLQHEGIEMHPPLPSSERVLMGPGPSNIHPRVMHAMSTPVVGHLDSEFLSMMDHLQQMLREVFQTENRLTMAISGTGSAGMETCLVNLLEPGDKAIVCINGVFGTRMKDIVARCGADAVVVEASWGEAIDPDALRSTLSETADVRVVALVHAETSTGVLQSMDEIAGIVKDSGAMLLLDTVTSLGGAEVALDNWGVDAAYSGTQKCLSCPPGLAPVSFSKRAVEHILSRKTPVQSWYLDTSMLSKYWGSERVYHHTAPISMNYALYEALRVVLDEGLEARWQNHRALHEGLVAGLEAMGLSLKVRADIRAPMLNAVKVPEGVDEKQVRLDVMSRFGLELGAGLGPLAGSIWRIGLMGHSCQASSVTTCLAALGWALNRQGCNVPDGVAAALERIGG